MNKTEQSSALSAYADSRLANDPPLRAVRAFEAIARLGSVTLALLLVARSGAGKSRQLAAGLIMLWPPSLICTIWVLVFFVW